MLQEFRIDNFKSLINVTFKPHDVNLLVGLNNAGKTNLCQALRFVAASTVVSLDQCADAIANSRRGITNHFLNKPTVDFFVKASLPHEGEKFVFEYNLTVSPPILNGNSGSLRVKDEKLSVTGGGFDGILLLENTPEQVRLLHERDYLEKNISNYVETTAPRDVTMLNRLYDLETNRLANLFKNYMAMWGYYDLSPGALRSASHKPNEIFLNPDGSNLSSVIYQLKTTNERDYRKLLGLVQRIEPRMDLINFQVAPENNVFMYFVDSEDHPLPAWNASNGTLRFLALAYILLIQRSPRLLIVEEPETGIYVGFLRDLLEMASQSPGYPQSIFTSHSPYFIDLFEKHLDGIFVVKRGEQHSTLIQPDIDKIKSRLDQFPLGEQHFREMLG